MPAIQSVQAGATLGVTVAGVLVSAPITTVAPNAVNAGAVETSIVSWLNTNAPTCQWAAHVFTLLPLTYTIYGTNLGVTIPANWWLN